MGLPFFENNYETIITTSKLVVMILTQDSPAIITITDQNGNAQKGVSVIVIADKDYIEKGVTDMYGKLTVPPVNSGYTDTDGKVNVQKYYVFVKDETKNIENALVTLNEDNTFSVKLPAECMIDYANRITVTVLDKDGNAVKGIGVAVSDNSENTESGITNENGQVIVPPTNFDYTDINGYSEVDGYIVTVKNETAPIEKANIKHTPEVLNEDGKISVKLPDTHTLTTSNQTTVTVTDKDNKPMANVSVTITDATTSKTGTTNSNGKVTLPVKSTGGGGGNFRKTCFGSKRRKN